MTPIPIEPKAEEPSPIKRAPKPGGLASFGETRQGHLGWVASLFLVMLGAKLWLIQRSETPLPFWDQWDGEAITLSLPYFQHHLLLTNLFEPHNDHRIFFSR